MAQPPPPNIRRTSSRVYDIHNPDDLTELARKLSRRSSHRRRSTGASRYTPHTPGGGETSSYGFPPTGHEGPYVAEPGEVADAGHVALATPLAVPRLKSYGQTREGEAYQDGEELGQTTSRRSRVSQRPREDSVREDEEEGSGSDDDDDSEYSHRLTVYAHRSG